MYRQDSEVDRVRFLPCDLHGEVALIGQHPGTHRHLETTAVGPPETLHSDDTGMAWYTTREVW